MQRVLVIDDNPDIGKALEVSLGLHDIHVHYVAEPQTGLDLLLSERFDLVIQDMNFTRDTTSGAEGVELFRQIRAADADLPIILLTAWTDLETAVSLVRAGAADYMAKPWDEVKLLTSVKNLLELRDVQTAHDRMVSERRQARHQLAKSYNLCGAIYSSDAMHHVFSLAAQVAAANVPVLITGPNGVGKDVVAHVIQANSPRRDKPFVTVDVGALPAGLVEAELFGAEAGAFTGAASRREGRFEAADTGTVFLDEIGNLSAEGQMKLLRVLQSGEYERLGSSKTRKVDVRIISATNTDLPAAIRARNFREDLFYRLNVIEIRIPALKDRRDDIIALARYFLPAEARLTAGAEDALLRYHWPGNVRELQNIATRAALMATNGRITAEALGLSNAPSASVDDAVAGPGPEEIRSVLEAHDGNVSRAARQLGLSRQALYRRLDKKA